ncbi:MAG: integrase [Nevskiaceae bacterium]|nr:MAG: integrase [Nevskiaceae bacterium]
MAENSRNLAAGAARPVGDDEKTAEGVGAVKTGSVPDGQVGAALAKLDASAPTAPRDWDALDREIHARSAQIQAPAIDLHRIDATTADVARATVVMSVPTNTLRAYAAAHAYLKAWHGLRTGQPFALPWSPAVLVHFVLDHYAHYETLDRGAVVKASLPHDVDQALVDLRVKAAIGPLKPSTVDHRLAYLSRLHREAGLASPADDPKARLVLRSIRRVAKRQPKAATRKAPALTREDMHKLLATCDHTPLGVRDRALLLFGWASGGRRRSEIASAVFQLLIPRGPNAFDYLLDDSKTTQAGEFSPDKLKPLRGTAAMAMAAWIALLERRGRQTSRGPIFLAISRQGDIGQVAMSASTINSLIKRKAKEVGLVGDFTAHSLRSGFVTQAHLDKVPAPEGMKRSGHTSLEMYNSYFRVDPERGDPADNLIDGR